MLLGILITVCNIWATIAFCSFASFRMSDATDSRARKRMQSLNSFTLLYLFDYLSFSRLLLLHLLHLSICISFSYNQAEHELIECVHTSIMRTHFLCYRNREYEGLSFFKPSNQVKHALFYIRTTCIRIARLGVTVI